MDKVVDGLDAEQVLNSRVFRESIEDVEKALINSILSVQYDGKPETDRYLVQTCLRLQDARNIKSALARRIASGKVDEKAFERKKKRQWTL